MPPNKNWTDSVRTTITPTKLALTDMSIRVRTEQFQFFMKNFEPDKETKILDVGVTSDESLKDSNMFEKLYPYPKKLTAATIEDKKKFSKLYPMIKTVEISRGEKLPFRDKEFDVVVSWATLEHVGSYDKQKSFIKELDRVGKSFFVTTPYRGCIYEPHAGIFFIHWLPLHLYRHYCKKTGRYFWADENNLNPLFGRDVRKIGMNMKLQVKIYRMFGIIPSHLLIYKKDAD